MGDIRDRIDTKLMYQGVSFLLAHAGYGQKKSRE